MLRQPEEKDILALAKLTVLNINDSLSIVKLRNLIDLVRKIDLKEFKLDKAGEDAKRKSVVALASRIQDLRNLENVALDLGQFSEKERKDAMAELFMEQAQHYALSELKNRLRAAEELNNQQLHQLEAANRKLSDKQTREDYAAKKAQIAVQIEAAVEQQLNTPENRNIVSDETVKRMLLLGQANEDAVNRRMQADKLVKTYNDLIARPSDGKRPEPHTSLADLINNVLVESNKKLDEAKSQRKMFKPRKSKVLQEMERHARELIDAVNPVTASKTRTEYARNIKSTPAKLGGEAIRLDDTELEQARILRMPFSMILDHKEFEQYRQEMKRIVFGFVSDDEGEFPAQYKALDKVRTSKEYTSDVIQVMMGILHAKGYKKLKELVEKYQNISFLDLYRLAIKEAIEKQAPKRKEQQRQITTGFQLFAESAKKESYKATKSTALNALLENAPNLLILAEKILDSEDPQLMERARQTAQYKSPTKAKSGPN